jgi:hypothetical protein
VRLMFIWCWRYWCWFWVVTLHGLVGIYKCFGGTFCTASIYSHEDGCCTFLWNFQPWRWRQCFLLKCWYLPKRPHEIITQKTDISTQSNCTNSCMAIQSLSHLKQTGIFWLHSQTTSIISGVFCHSVLSFNYEVY